MRTVFVSALVGGVTIYGPRDFVEIPQVGDVIVVDHGPDMLHLRIDCRVWYSAASVTLLCVPIGHDQQSPAIPNPEEKT